MSQHMITFLKNLFGFSSEPPPISLNESNTLKEASLNERNALRAKKEKVLIEKKKAKAKFLREKADKAFSESATKYYAEWLEEFQFRLHMGADESDLRFTEEDEIRGTLTINNTIFSVTTKLGTVSRMSPAVRTTITFECSGLEAPMKFIINVIANTSLVGQMQPAVQADKCLDTLKKQAQIIHMNKVVQGRAERKRLKREKLERNRLRNIARKEASNFEQPNQLVLVAK